MKVLTDKEEIEFAKFKQDSSRGDIFLRDDLKAICEAHDYNPEQIGRYILKVTKCTFTKPV